MRTVAIFVFIFFAQTYFSQSFDTLYFGNRKFPLQKVKVNYAVYQPGIAYLPVEYKELKNELKIPFRDYYDSTYACENDKYGNCYLVFKPEKIKYLWQS